MRYEDDGGGTIGTITSVIAPFCVDCYRLRIAADGHAFTCLFARQGIDLCHWLREDVVDSLLQNALSELWSVRSYRFSKQRGLEQTLNHHAEMAYLGG